MYAGDGVGTGWSIPADEAAIHHGAQLAPYDEVNTQHWQPPPHQALSRSFTAPLAGDYAAAAPVLPHTRGYGAQEPRLNAQFQQDWPAEDAAPGYDVYGTRTLYNSAPAALAQGYYPGGGDGSFYPGAVQQEVYSSQPHQYWAAMHEQVARDAAAVKKDVESAERGAVSSSVALWRELSYSARRLLYFIDHRAGSLKFQVFMLAFFAAVWVLSWGKVLMVVRNKESEKSKETARTTYSEGVWLAWSLLTDPGWGTWRDLGATGLWVRVVAEMNVIVGLLFLATIVGVITDAVDEKLSDLNKGLSSVQETGHIVLLGWGESALTVIKEVSMANESSGGGVVVVLAENEKEDMERDLASFVHTEPLYGTKVVFRSGSRLHKADLNFVACEYARSIIVLPNGDLDADLADAELLHVALNLTTMTLQSNCCVVAEVRDKDNEPLVTRLGSGLVCTVASHDLCGRLMILFVRSPGLARVYSNILGFEGNEFYVQKWPQLAGTQWVEVALHFEGAIPIGVRRPDGLVQLNPPPGYCVSEEDALVVLAEDDDSYTWHEAIDVGPRGQFRDQRVGAAVPECILFAGWRRDLVYVILMLDHLVPPGSELHILCDVPLRQRQQEFESHEFDHDRHLVNLRIFHYLGSPVLARGIEQVPIERLTGAVIMAEQVEKGTSISSDSTCLASLLLLRSIQTKRMRQRTTPRGTAPSMVTSASFNGNGATHGPMHVSEPMPGVTSPEAVGVQQWSESEAAAAAKAMPVVVEILDPRTQRMVADSYKVWSISDFMHSNELMSKILAMISEERTVKAILDELMGETGTQFELKPAESILQPDTTSSFLQLAVECVAYRRCILCGYFEAPVPGSREQPKLTINPSDKKTKRLWRGCQLVLITTKEH